jgi:hypothetical protein
MAAAPQFQAQQPPMSLTVGTSGMPDPATIAKQKDAYSKMLEQQLKQGITVLDAQVKHQKDYLVAQADQQKKQFTMQIEMEVKQQEMQLQQQYAEQTMALQQQAAQQKAALEQQAMQLTMEYQQKKAEEDMQRQQFEMEKQQAEMQAKMSADMQKLGVQVPMMGGMQAQQTVMPSSFGVSGIGAPQMQVQQQPVGPTYVYGPNGELLPKDDGMQQQYAQ